MTVNKNRFTKSERKELRRLSGLAYERELAKALESLEGKFGQWRKNEITGFELSDFIHKFHNGISRDLWKMYEDGDNYVIIVARAVADGIIAREEVESEILQKIEQWINVFTKE